MLMPSSRVYEFNFESLSIRDFLLLKRFSDASHNPDAIEGFMKLGAKFCDFDPLDLPWAEFENFTTQLSQGLVIAFRLPDNDGAEG